VMEAGAEFQAERKEEILYVLARAGNNGILLYNLQTRSSFPCYFSVVAD
jgi:hypothetical protein